MKALRPHEPGHNHVLAVKAYWRCEVYREIEPYLRLVDEGQRVPLSFFEVLVGMAFAAFAEAHQARAIASGTEARASAEADAEPEPEAEL